MWGQLTFRVYQLPPKLPQKWGICSGTAWDLAGHYIRKHRLKSSGYWTFLVAVGSSFGGGGGNRTPVRVSLTLKHRVIKSDKALRNQDAQETDLLPSDKVWYLKLAHFWNVFLHLN